MRILERLNEKSIRLYLGASAAVGALLGTRPAYAIDPTTVENLTKRGLGMFIWVAIGVFGIVGIVVFGTGVMRMWDTDDPRQKKSGMARMGWGAFLLISVLVAVGLKMYLTQGQGPTASDVNPYGGGFNSPSSVIQ
jgi:Na+/proline symporter